MAQSKAVRERPLALGGMLEAAMVRSLFNSLSDTPFTAAPYSVAVRLPAAATTSALTCPTALRRDSKRLFLAVPVLNLLRRTPE